MFVQMRLMDGSAHLTDPLGERERVEHEEIVHFEREAGEQEDEVGDREVREVRVGRRAHVAVREQDGERDGVPQDARYEDERVDGREREQLPERQAARQERLGVQSFRCRTARREVGCVRVGAQAQVGGHAGVRVGRWSVRDETIGYRQAWIHVRQTRTRHNARDQSDRSDRLENGKHDDCKRQSRVKNARKENGWRFEFEEAVDFR